MNGSPTRSRAGSHAFKERYAAVTSWGRKMASKNGAASLRYFDPGSLEAARLLVRYVDIKLVGNEGIAPPSSGCRPAALLLS